MDSLTQRLKTVPCPHCHRVGCLILHGWTTGYEENSLATYRRSRRFLCNKRRRRKTRGCGRTFSSLPCTCLKGFVISAESLWGFIANVHKGMNKSRAFAALGLGFCASTPYRLWKRFVLAGAAIRSTLLSLGVPPPVDSPDPTRQTIAHLLATFPQHPCPVADFQFQLQKAFL